MLQHLSTGQPDASCVSYDLPLTDENSMHAYGNNRQLSERKYIPPHKINPCNTNVSGFGSTFLCFLCNEMYKPGNCTLAGRVMSAMTCHVCKNALNSKFNTKHAKRPHYFNKAGRIIMESCPSITEVPQQSRVEHLEDIGHCPKCLSTADRCP